MESLTCPQCQGEMEPREYAGAAVSQCSRCQGVFLSRADLGRLAEAETDLHAHRSAHTAPMPRITADMTAPPKVATPPRTLVEALFAQS